MREAAIVSTARIGIGKPYRGYLNATAAPALAGYVHRWQRGRRCLFEID